MASLDGPDCLCVGLARAGTGWLYHQLRDHPDFWMPPIKELDYLDRTTPKLPEVLMRRQRLESGVPKRVDERDRDFVYAAASLAGQPRDLRSYMNLFRFKGDRMSGDITPSYARLDESLIREIAALMPKVRIVFLIRDPVERAWSRFSMLHRDGHVDPGLPGNPDALAEYLRVTERFGDASRPTRVIARWAHAAPDVAFRHFFYDDLIVRPAWLRSEILSFLGVDPRDSFDRAPPEINRKAGRHQKLPFADDARRVFVAHYRDELIRCAEQLEPYGRGWAARYGF
jgi:hypothetical protein